MSSAFPSADSHTFPSLRFRILCVIAVVAFLIYLVWNVFWLLQGRIPPAIFYGFTGYPSPTTGGTRAIVNLWQGNWQESLRFNAMAVPIITVIIYSIFNAARNRYYRGRFLIDSFVVKILFACLLVAWALKLVGDRAYW